MTMSRFLKGCYLDLLVAQFNSGPLSLEEIRTVLGSDFGQAWPSLQKKFKTENGNFFNERLETEKAKRTAYSQSRSKNRKKITYDTTHEQTYVPHMENEDKNENAIEKGKGVQGENNFKHIGTPNGHRMTILPRYANEVPIIIHNLAEYFKSTGQLEEITASGWTDFAGFMKANPGRQFASPSEVYHSFKKYSTQPNAKDKPPKQFKGEFSGSARM